MSTENESVAVTIEEDISVVESRRWSRQSIYRIPATTVAAKNEKHYKPEMVSIGPYHRGERHLKAMEEHKRRAQRHLLKRSGRDYDFLHGELKQVVEILKDSYDDNARWNDGNDDDEFLDVMITDGCFLLEIMRSATAAERKPPQNSKDGAAAAIASSSYYPDNDPIFSEHGNLNFVPYLRCDMLKLENQIPMLALRTLYCALTSPLQNCSDAADELNKLILRFLNKNPDDHDMNELGKCRHILDLYQKSLLFVPKEDREKLTKTATSNNNKSPSSSLSATRHDRNMAGGGGGAIIRSATELREAGIKIRESKTKSLQDITFRKQYLGLSGGVLTLPHIEVDDSFLSSFLNVLAYERFHVGAGKGVTCYTFFMAKIIDGDNDVKLLRDRNVIENALGSDGAVAKLFNSLSSDSPLDLMTDHLKTVHCQVSRFRRSHFNRWRANLCNNYLANPWVAIGFVAGIFIFAVTTVQTVYAVMDFHRKKS